MGEVRIDTPMSCQRPDVTSGNTVIFRFGDTLQHIADCNHVDLKDLMAANYITDPNSVLPGREINIPKGGYAAPEPTPAGTPRQPSSAPNAGSIDPKSMTELKVRQATIDGLVHKAHSVGLGPGEVAIISSLATRILSPAEFNRTTGVVQEVLSSANPKAAMAKLGPTIVQGSSDPVTSAATSRLARKTGFTTTSLAPGSLEGVDDVTIVAHGNEIEIGIRGERFSPAQLTEKLRESGWEGGTIRLVSCKTGTSSATFAKDLATELNARGMGSAVMAPNGDVLVRGKPGLPQVEDAAGKLRAPGKGWNIFVDESPELLHEGTTVTAALETEDGIGALSGMRAGAGEVLGFIGFMIEPLNILSNYFNSYEDAKNAIKSDSYQKGFAQGMADAIVGESTSDVRTNFGFEVADPSMTDRILGAEGLREQYHNKGLVDGYKLFHSLPPDQQKMLRDDLAAQGQNVKSKDRDNVLHLGVNILPNVKEMFKKAQEEEEALREDADFP